MLFFDMFSFPCQCVDSIFKFRPVKTAAGKSNTLKDCLAISKKKNTEIQRNWECNCLTGNWVFCSLRIIGWNGGDSKRYTESWCQTIKRYRRNWCKFVLFDQFWNTLRCSYFKNMNPEAAAKTCQMRVCSFWLIAEVIVKHNRSKPIEYHT